MKKTVFVVTEQRVSASEQEAKEIVRQRVEHWLKGELRK